MRKVRNKVIGTIGDAYLSYNRYTNLLSLKFLSAAPHSSYAV